ncbi:MAG: hypothetical protein JNL80_04580 [Phycisphaerae bacterium]|jgi:hypothetical protein|nr:hypothetical protein [Phycisphaerae bacterium]
MLTINSLVLVAAIASAAERGAPANAIAKQVGGGLAGLFCPCPSDFDGNGSIDAADLAALLGGWGSPGTDLDGNGTTDAADLSILLGSWGPCAGIPSNDLCQNAAPIFEGDTAFCTFGAGTEAPPYSAGSGCVEFGYNSMTADVWYSFIAPEAGEVTLSTCGVSWDTRLAVYTTSGSQVAQCPISEFSDTEIVACNDDHAGCGNGSLVTFSTVAGQEYKIRVGGYIGWSGEGTLHLDFDPLGAVCNEAIDLGITYSEFLEGSTLIYDAGEDQSPCALGDTVAKWYMFASDCGHVDGLVTISTCHAGTDFDTTISVWASSPGGCPGFFVACNDDFTDPSCQIDGLNRKSRVQFLLGGPTLYFVRVSGYNGAKGNFELSIDVDCNN